MRCIILLGVLLLTGCTNVRGPFNQPPERVDDPRFPIAEQERRGRDRLPLPEAGKFAPSADFTPPR